MLYCLVYRSFNQLNESSFCNRNGQKRTLSEKKETTSQGRWRLAGRLTERCFNFIKIAEKRQKIPELECFQDKNTRRKGRVRIPLFPQKMHYSRHPWSSLKGS